MSRPVLRILGKAGCCLCTEARQAAERLRSRYEFQLEYVDVEGDDALKSRYQYEVPVGFLNGRKVFKYRLEEGRIAELLRRAAVDSAVG